MNGINIQIEAADFIGHIEAARSIGRVAVGEVFLDEGTGRLIICQPDQCLVIG